MEEENNNYIDISIIQVIDIFKTYVTNPKYIDNLILTHSYTSDMWKNGSKYLYFYTLHNQEHAIDLIKNSIKFIKVVDFIQISKYDYYLIFIACYLHDISMVQFPDLYSFTMENDRESNLIYFDFIRKFKENTENTLRKVDIIELYKKVDQYFEGKVRGNHSIDSGYIIRNSKELSFLETSVREHVAQISEAHGYDCIDIYRIKSYGKSKKLNIKFDKIILRFADLLDISYYRVSIPILNNNIENMSKISAFHWLSHHYIEGYQIINQYKTKCGIEEGFLQPKNIEEQITLKINLNSSNLIKVKSKECNECRLNNYSTNKLELVVGEKCDKNECNFSCKWMAKKNDYLYKELKELKDYLYRNKENFYDTKINIEICMDKNRSINNSSYGKIEDIIENEE